MFFFIMGINTKAKDIGRLTNIVCPACGGYTSLQIQVIYEVCHFFFIPLFKWNRRYLAKAYDCNAIFEVERGEGRAFEKGEKESIDPQYLHQIRDYGSDNGYYGPGMACPHCGAELPRDAMYCHRCGNRV